MASSPSFRLRQSPRKGENMPRKGKVSGGRVGKGAGGSAGVGWAGRGGGR